MKNLFILTVLGLLALTSCKKEYACECKNYIDGVYIDTDEDVITIKDTKSKAEDKCNGYDEEEEYGGYTYTIDCEI